MHQFVKKLPGSSLFELLKLDLAVSVLIGYMHNVVYDFVGDIDSDFLQQLLKLFPTDVAIVISIHL